MNRRLAFSAFVGAVTVSLAVMVTIAAGWSNFAIAATPNSGETGFQHVQDSARFVGKTVHWSQLNYASVTDHIDVVDGVRLGGTFGSRWALMGFL